MVSLLHWSDRRAAPEHEVNPQVGLQIRLEHNDVHVRRSIETPVDVCWTLGVHFALVNVVKSFVIRHHSDIRVRNHGARV